MAGPRQYDAIGEHYDGVKGLPVGLAETATLLAALPDLAGAAVLDVGTGTGFYPRRFARFGAARVLGVDASAGMIDEARRVERSAPLGISYEVHDAARLPVFGAFDVVTAVWLLGYAEDLETLDAMLAGLAANLAEGGSLVALVPNPDFAWDCVAAQRRYGLSITATGFVDGRMGSTVTFDCDPPFTIEGRSWPPGAIEAALARAGLVGVRRHPVAVPPDAPTSDFWTELLANPTFAVFSAQRPGYPT